MRVGFVALALVGCLLGILQGSSYATGPAGVAYGDRFTAYFAAPVSSGPALGSYYPGTLDLPPTVDVVAAGDFSFGFSASGPYQVAVSFLRPDGTVYSRTGAPLRCLSSSCAGLIPAGTSTFTTSLCMLGYGSCDTATPAAVSGTVVLIRYTCVSAGGCGAAPASGVMGYQRVTLGF